MEHQVWIFIGAFQDEDKIRWDLVMDSTFSGREARDISWEEFRVEFNEKYYPPDVRKRRKREF